MIYEPKIYTSSLHEDAFDYVLFVDVPFESNKKLKGVYLIDNVYVGASIHIRSRIRQHVWDSIAGRSSIPSISNHIRFKISRGEVIQVRFLDPDPLNEEHWYRIFFGEPTKANFYHQNSKLRELAGS